MGAEIDLMNVCFIPRTGTRGDRPQQVNRIEQPLDPAGDRDGKGAYCRAWPFHRVFPKGAISMPLLSGSLCCPLYQDGNSR